MESKKLLSFFLEIEVNFVFFWRKLEKNTGYRLAVLVYGQKLDLGILVLTLQLGWCCGSLHHQSLD